MKHTLKVYQELQSQLVFMAHAARQRDSFEISQHLSDAAEAIGKALRAFELEHQRTADTPAGEP